MTIRIVTDSTADLEPSDIERHGIVVVPLNIHFGADVFRDGVDMSKSDFYDRLVRSAVLPRTSQPSVSDFQQVYEDLADAEAIVSVHIGGKLSGTVNAAQTAARLLTEGSSTAPQVTVVDSEILVRIDGKKVFSAHSDRQSFSLFGLYLYHARARFKNLRIRTEKREMPGWAHLSPGARPLVRPAGAATLAPSPQLKGKTSALSPGARLRRAPAP